MTTLVLILFVLGLVLVVLEAFGIHHPRVKFGWLGVGCWMLGILLERVG